MVFLRNTKLRKETYFFEEEDKGIWYESWDKSWGYFLFFWLILKLIWGAGSMSPCRNPLSALVNNILEKTTVSQKPICWRFYDSMLFLVWLHLHIYPSIINKFFLFFFIFTNLTKGLNLWDLVYYFNFLPLNRP